MSPVQSQPHSQAQMAPRPAADIEMESTAPSPPQDENSTEPKSIQSRLGLRGGGLIFDLCACFICCECCEACIKGVDDCCCC
ncbi:hypothetical protein M406DRAFT_356651 [Cryphonectria parasitica EP155]|uniref:Cysteine-rich transmembrane CYSTM domain-containing protein n=1 Tax=Cryphonectria parasitica (strain ATCC 38755 / EP155) TaxID=660469 RepID=A0A9P4Y232_CRYP1|nr:uncharacterized protein M406DRAFT_356651 [Cryphonectria parasitica EP155]KAF3764745.1 hypothetical protein M406DRAFT_356651 [Cryphonectria parasitica EP155]